MKSLVNKYACVKIVILVTIILWILISIQCVRDKSINEPMSGYAFFPMAEGQTQYYHVKYVINIGPPPHQHTIDEGIETWHLIRKNDFADTVLVYDVEFSGIKISIDTSGVADTTFDQIFSTQVSCKIQDGCLVNLDDSDTKVFFDNWLTFVDFKIDFPDSVGQSIQHSSQIGNTLWNYTLERNVGLVGGEWSSFPIFGFFHLEYNVVVE